MFHKLKGRLKSGTLDLTIVCALCVEEERDSTERKYVSTLDSKGKKKKSVRHSQYKREPEIVLPFCPDSCVLWEGVTPRNPHIL